MTKKPALHKLKGSDLFRSGMTVKPGMKHFTPGEENTDMKNHSMPEEGNHIAARRFIRRDLPEGILLRLVPFPDAEIRIVIKLCAELPAVELDNKAPAIKVWVLPAIWRVSDKKVVVKLHI